MELTGFRVQSWAAFGTYVDGRGALLGPMLAVLGRSWALLGGLEPLLGPLCPVLGCSWSLCWRSWTALVANLGDLGPLLGPLWAVLARQVTKARAGSMQMRLLNEAVKWGFLMRLFGTPTA